MIEKLENEAINQPHSPQNDFDDEVENSVSGARKSRSPTPKRTSFSEKIEEKNQVDKYYPIEVLDLSCLTDTENPPTDEDIAFMKEDFYRSVGQATLEYFLVYERLWETECNITFTRTIKPLIEPLMEENPAKKVVQNNNFRGLLAQLGTLNNMVMSPSLINLSEVYDLMTNVGLKAREFVGPKSRVFELIKYKITKLKPDMKNKELLLVLYSLIPKSLKIRLPCSTMMRLQQHHGEWQAGKMLRSTSTSQIRCKNLTANLTH